MLLDRKFIRTFLGHSRSHSSHWPSIPRTLPEAVSNLVLLFLSLVCPVAQYFPDTMSLDGKDVFRTHFFSSAIHSETMTGLELCDHIRMFFRTFAPANTALSGFSIRFWRQVAIAIGRYHIGDNFSSHPQSPESDTSMIGFALVASACHSPGIDSIKYACDRALHPTLTPLQKMVFDDVCRRWHAIFKWQSLVVRPIGTVTHQRSPLLESTLCEMVHRVFTVVQAALKSLFGFQGFKSQTLEFAMLSVISRSDDLLIVTPMGPESHCFSTFPLLSTQIVRQSSSHL
jgi:hypothetical protein